MNVRQCLQFRVMICLVLATFLTMDSSLVSGQRKGVSRRDPRRPVAITQGAKGDSAKGKVATSKAAAKSQTVVVFKNGKKMTVVSAKKYGRGKLRVVDARNRVMYFDLNLIEKFYLVRKDYTDLRPYQPYCVDIRHYAAMANPVKHPNVRGVLEDFIAKGDKLTSVRIRLNGSGDIRVRIQKRGDTTQTIHDFTTTIQSPWTIMNFDEPIAVESGQTYRVRIERPAGNSSTFDAYVSRRDEYVFSSATCKIGNNWAWIGDNETIGVDKQADLIMKVDGKRCFKMPKVPTKRALLVLLENGGIGSSLRVASLDLANAGSIRYIVYKHELDGEEIKFRLLANETLGQALARLGGQLSNLAAEATSSLSAAYTVGQSLLNLNNWSIRSITAEQAVNEYSDFLLEDITSSQILNKTQGRYHHRVILEDNQFTEDNVLEVIEQLAGQYAIDIHVLSHGAVNTIVGYNDDYLQRGFFRALMKKKWQRHAAGLPMYFRAVYQMNCDSGTLKREWRALGTNVVSGTSGEFPENATLNCLPIQYFDFLNEWYQDGEDFDDALEDSFDTAKNKVDDAPNLLLWAMGQLGIDTSSVGALWQKVLDSELSASGNGNLKWNSACAIGF